MAPFPRTFRSLARLVPLASLLAVLLFPASSLGATKGVETDLTWGTGSKTEDQTVAQTQDLGAGWMRLTMVWGDVETSPGTYSPHKLSMYDAAIAKVHNSGMQVLVTVYGAPSW